MSKIKGMRRLPETTGRLGGETKHAGDNWHMTWAADDTQLVGLCDGSGWPQIRGHELKSYNSRIFKIHGEPPEPEFENLPGFPNLLSRRLDLVNRYYGFGIIALDDHIYQYMSTPNTPFSERGARFAGAKLIYSPDMGTTWKNQDGAPSVAYNATLGEYMMLNWGMGIDANGRWFGKPSYMGLWTSPEPWGPWTQVSEELEWLPQGDAAVKQPG
jgi:hypothetical protein